MYRSTISFSSQTVWKGAGHEGEVDELVLDCCLLDHGRRWDCVGFFAKADEGAYGWYCIAIVSILNSCRH